MAVGIRQRLMIGFGSLLAVIALVGAVTLAQINRLGRTPGVILKENYHSVIACQEMKESLERMDSGILFTLAGREKDGEDLVAKFSLKFRSALDVELKNITLPGEREKAQEIDRLFGQYMKTVSEVINFSRPLEERKKAYFSSLMPVFVRIKELAQDILVINQKNMIESGQASKRMALMIRHKMLTGIIVSAALSLVFGYLAQKWILLPINKLIAFTKEVGKGNFDLTVDVGTNDEIGRLSRSFNEMTAALRHVGIGDRADLMKRVRATEEVFKILPDAVAVLDSKGKVQISTGPAAKIFGLKPGALLADLDLDWLPPLIQQAFFEERPVSREGKAGMIQKFVERREAFFEPLVVPIALHPEKMEPTAYALILKDVTQVQEQRELKRGVLSTVLHQLRTPLTSLRLAIHMLIENKLGPLNERQTDLLLTAKDDGERLVAILDDLLDLNRIESDKSHVATKPCSPLDIVSEAAERHREEAGNKGIELMNSINEDFPEVMADPERIGHVFDNLISNALKHTRSGGRVTLGAKPEPDYLKFTVEDTGEGIPSGYLARLFEPFYRVPSDGSLPGTGLGLSIVKEIVEAHGGKVGVESVPGKGSTFFFTLPFFVG